MRIVLRPCPTSPRPTRLAAAAVHVWHVPLDPAPLPPRDLLADLTDEEQARAARYRGPRVRDQFVVGRGLLRRVLAGYLGVAPRDVPLVYEGSGKPALAEPLLHFNLTHADGVALIAVAARPVGVDVERVREVPNAEGLVDRFFSAAERDAYRRLPVAERPAAFFRGWTSKEAVIKAVGASIESLAAFDVEMDPKRPPAVLAATHEVIGRCRWALAAWAPAAGYAAAVAVEGDGPLTFGTDGFLSAEHA